MSTRWMVDGLCRKFPPEYWFPIGTSGPAAAQAEEAKAVCRRCPVVERCLRYALDTPQLTDGVWGGKTVEERRLIKARETGGGGRVASGADPAAVDALIARRLLPEQVRPVDRRAAIRQLLDQNPELKSTDIADQLRMTMTAVAQIILRHKMRHQMVGAGVGDTR